MLRCSQGGPGYALIQQWIQIVSKNISAGSSLNTKEQNPTPADTAKWFLQNKTSI